MKKIVLSLLTVTLVTLSVNAKAQNNDKGMYQAFLNSSYLYRLSAGEYKNALLAMYDGRNDFSVWASPDVKEIYRSHLEYLLQMAPLTDPDMVQIINETQFDAAPADLGTYYAIGRLPTSKNPVKSTDFSMTREPYRNHGELVGYFRGTLWTSVACGNPIRPNTAAPVQQPMQYQPPNEDQTVYRPIGGGNTNTNTNSQPINNYYYQDRNESSQQQQSNKLEVTIRQKRDAVDWINTAANVVNAATNSATYVRGVRFSGSNYSYSGYVPARSIGGSHQGATF